ncbi:hypothetical protein B0E33_05705 [Roseibium algicola]|jgi:hypothetical protein|uniref:Uncharacterized protein n=2 Tax=Stappiaceae TaxID=2821832 RepID=A0ABN4WSI7_9HYPH|nr:MULTISPECIES: hypothetical protein [Stappiaceae]MCR9285339.1 hypothetical protein [Paracoccaceae bacterium]MEC9422616.1 hypothetical protein [Pseudomonadota bacterium]AMN54673.1 hypothetical protein ACP90_22280 [Labrenzia sp. CP4]AQQ03153.1 hypothetical protein B0E33_05705 [Roseibium aggregatum]MEC9469715.1 hypothetical protein [Pseudomonadota bacterium]
MECLHPVLGAGELAAERLEQANINPQTGLATDYLNHFNEVMMLLEMLPDMPDCAEDVLEWEPLDYEGHFENSSFKDKNLAIMAYHAAPNFLREHLEKQVAGINRLVGKIQDQLRETPDPAMIATDIADRATNEIKPLIAVAGAVIHGHVEPEATQHEGEGAQAEIDALFA